MEKRRLDYQKALELRSAGMTYGEIRKAFSIPKSTLSSWFKYFEVKGKALTLLKKKQGENMILLAKFNKERSLRIKDENENIRREFESLVGNISIRELTLIGAVLYWAEGQKVFNHKGIYGPYPVPVFSNSDPSLIILFLKFLENVLGVSKSLLRPWVYLYPNLSPQKSVNYWAKITKIPINQFRYYTALSRASRQKRPKNILPYGTLHIRVRRRQEFFKIKGLIDGIIKSMQ